MEESRRESRQPASREYAAPRKRNRRHRGLFALKLIGTLFTVAVLTVAMFSAIFMRYVKTTLSPNLDIDASGYTMKLSSVVYYKDKATGNWVELQKLHGTENRTLVEFSDIPEHVWQVLLLLLMCH